jgi:hypothetical protein
MPVEWPGGHFGTIWAKTRTRLQTAAYFNLVRSIDLLVQLQEGGGGASMA